MRTNDTKGEVRRRRGGGMGRRERYNARARLPRACLVLTRSFLLFPIAPSLSHRPAPGVTRIHSYRRHYVSCLHLQTRLIRGFPHRLDLVRSSFTRACFLVSAHLCASVMSSGRHIKVKTTKGPSFGTSVLARQILHKSGTRLAEDTTAASLKRKASFNGPYLRSVWSFAGH